MRELLIPAVQPRAAGDPYRRAYLVMRIAIGVVGVALPVLLVFGEPTLFDGQPFPRGSLSAYYYSGGRELFVGSLFAIGFFLITYKFLDVSWENALSVLAGGAAIIVALFPTGRPGKGVPANPLQDLLSETTVERIHFVSAAIFIASLAVITCFFARRPVERRRSKFSPKFWTAYHLFFAGLIFAALALAAVAGITSRPDKGLLIAEVVAVLAFGASWFAKGFEIPTLLGRQDESVEEPPATGAVPTTPS